MYKGLCNKISFQRSILVTKAKCQGHELETFRVISTFKLNSGLFFLDHIVYKIPIFVLLWTIMTLALNLRSTYLFKILSLSIYCKASELRHSWDYNHETSHKRRKIHIVFTFSNESFSKGHLSGPGNLKYVQFRSFSFIVCKQ